MSYSDEDELEPPPPYPTRGSKPFRPRAAPNPAGNDDDMMDLANRLEEESVNYKELCEELARADADYHFVYHTAMVSLPINIKPAEKRKAMASIEAAEQYALFRLLQERQKGHLQYLRSISQKIDVSRTIAANYRGQG
jgi:hypothetical protein